MHVSENMFKHAWIQNLTQYTLVRVIQLIHITMYMYTLITFVCRIMLTCLFTAGVTPQGQLCVVLAKVLSKYIYLEQHTKPVRFIRGTFAVSRNYRLNVLFCLSRLWFPCVDSHSELCPWDISITAPANMFALASGELTEQVKCRCSASCAGFA